MTVATTTLDNLLADRTVDYPALLKADVQGSEMEVLVGAESTIFEFEWIYLEVSFLEFYAGQPLAHEVIDFLHQRSFVLDDLGQPTVVAGRAVQVDMLFRKAKRSADERN